MTPPPSLSSRPLLTSLLIALAATGCGDDRKTTRVSYTPGVSARSRTSPEKAPTGPCAAAGDPATLGYLSTGCWDDVRVESGPVESTDAKGVRECSYEVSYVEREGGCPAIGRPLRRDGVATVARLHVGTAWGDGGRHTPSALRHES